jgi:transcription initiation factor TFIIB
VSQNAESAGDRCPECRVGRLVMDASRAEVSCENCGLVVSENLIDQGPDWRSFSDDARGSQERAAPLSNLQHDYGFGTVMWGSTDAHGRAVSSNNLPQLKRMQKWDRRSKFRRGTERNLATALTEIRRMAGVLDVPRAVQEMAGKFYRTAAEKNLIRGRSIDSVAAACLYAALRQSGIPRSLEEIAGASKVDRREIGRVYKVVAHELGLTLAPVTPQSYIPRFASRLRLKPETEALALNFVKEAVLQEKVSGKDPKSVAAAALYIACILKGDPRTQKDVSEATGVTEVTIRNRYKELVQSLGITFDFVQ